MTKYKLLGKIGIAFVEGDLPRTGDIVVVPSDTREPTRFRVLQVQHVLELTNSAGMYTSRPPEVHVELVD